MATAATPPSFTLQTHPPSLAFLRPILKRRLSFSYLVDFKFLYLRERRCVSPALRLSASAIKIHAHFLPLPRPRPRRRAQLRPLGRRRRQRQRRRRWKTCKFLIKCDRDSVSEASVNTIKGPGGHELKMAGSACDPADVPDDHESRCLSSAPKSRRGCSAGIIRRSVGRRVVTMGINTRHTLQKQWQCGNQQVAWRPEWGVATVFSPIDFGSW